MPLSGFQFRLLNLCLVSVGGYWGYTQMRSYREFNRWKKEELAWWDDGAREEVSAIIAQNIFGGEEETPLFYSVIKRSPTYKQLNSQAAKLVKQLEPSEKKEQNEQKEQKEQNEKEELETTSSLSYEILPTKARIAGPVKFSHSLSRSIEMVPSFGQYVREKDFYERARSSEETVPVAVRAREFAEVPLDPSPIWSFVVDVPLQVLWPNDVRENFNIRGEGVLRILDRDAPLPPSVYHEYFPDEEEEGGKVEGEKNGEGEKENEEKKKEAVEQSDSNIDLIRNVVFEMTWNRVSVNGNNIWETRSPLSDGSFLAVSSYQNSLGEAEFNLTGAPIEVKKSRVSLSVPTGFYYFME